MSLPRVCPDRLQYETYHEFLNRSKAHSPRQPVTCAVSLGPAPPVIAEGGPDVRMPKQLLHLDHASVEQLCGHGCPRRMGRVALPAFELAEVAPDELAQSVVRVASVCQLFAVGRKGRTQQRPPG